MEIGAGETELGERVALELAPPSTVLTMAVLPALLARIERPRGSVAA